MPLLKRKRSEREEGAYDPHLHREVEKPCTNFETYVHLFKSVLGTGILAMPEAFYNSGYIIGFIGTLLTGALCVYCLNKLVSNQYVLCKRKQVPLLTYPQTMAIACQEGPKCLRSYEKFFCCLVDVLLIIYQLGICCVYVVFVAEALKSVCDPYVNWSIQIYMLIILLPFILMNCIRNLKYLAPFSTFANILIFVSLGIVIYYYSNDIPKILDINPWGKPQTIPLFIGTTLFALNAVGVLLALENNMKTPKSFGGFTGVLSIGMFFISLLYAFMGLMGYIRFGRDCKASVTLNLPHGILAQSVNVMYAIAVFISFGLQGYVPVQILWNTFLIKRLEGRNHLLLWEYLFRVILVLITFVAAISIPRLGLFISLFGAFCLSLLGVSFPALIEICVMHPNHGYLKWHLVKNMIIVLIGITALFIGTTTTVIAIVNSFRT